MIRAWLGRTPDHAGDRIAALDMLAGGITLMLLRLYADALWLPVGYHWAWNVLQTTVFGVSESAPSIRPFQIHCPARWMGQPGQPEPGLLSTLVHLVIALLVWWLLWRGRTQQRP